MLRSSRVVPQLTGTLKKQLICECLFFFQTFFPLGSNPGGKNISPVIIFEILDKCKKGKLQVAILVVIDLLRIAVAILQL